MRKIKFRGISIKENKWVYGDLIQTQDKVLISVNGFLSCYVMPEYEVFKHSVGQYTGLKDKNGIEIYEDDIIKLDSWNCKHIVRFVDGAFCLDSGIGYLDDIHYVHHAERNQATILGNIYDNPELIKKIANE